ncbi:BspA family leucine-rich repeat surface protein [Candidatus Saccharibacteria bacterium]|nr:BspA family leucine-rich repeat surface protein [Candidatus Saccharibacteria bacterium]
MELYARPKIATMEPRGGGWFNRELKLLLVFFGLISFCNLVFSDNTFALYTPTLSASVDNSDVTISGNNVVNSHNQLSFNSMNLTVKTNNRTGYTAAISTETDDTSLKNLDSTLGAKIQSITENLALNNFTANTWGYKMGSENNFKPIPAASNPSNIIQTAVGTEYDETNKINIGMKLSDTLESGNYTNKIIVSVVSNPYEKKARINRGYDFNTSVGNLDKNQTVIDGKGKRDNIYHIKRSLITKDLIPADAVNIENGNTSDYEVKIWFVPSENTVYYWTEANKITLSKDSSFMFDRMPKLQTIDLSGFDTSEAENMARMFSNSPELKSLDFSSFNTGKVKDFTYTFYDAKNIESLDLSMFDTSSATTMYGMFNGMTALKNLNISSFNTQNVTEMQEMFQYNSSLTSLDLSHFDTRKVKNMRSMFNGMSNVTSLDLSSFDTGKVTDMYGMFLSATKLTNLNVSSFNTYNVTTMRYMFSGLQELTSLNVTNFNTENVTDMSYMFYKMNKIIDLDLSSFNTQNVTDMGGMFAYVTNLKSLNLANFNTRKVTNMYSMFSSMTSLTELDLSNFDTSNVINMDGMFYHANSLTSLDLSNFDTSNVVNMQSMFELGDEDTDKDKLTVIYVNNDFDTSKVTIFTNMFKNRKRLRGGNGSYLSDPSTADKTWLRVDRPGVQGYFTKKA